MKWLSVLFGVSSYAHWALAGWELAPVRWAEVVSGWHAALAVTFAAGVMLQRMDRASREDRDRYYEASGTFVLPEDER